MQDAGCRIWLPDSLPASRRLTHGWIAQVVSQDTLHGTLGCAQGTCGRLLLKSVRWLDAG